MQQYRSLRANAWLFGFCLFGSVHLFAVENARDAFLTDDYHKQMATLEMMSKIDANGDHKVSKQEFDDYYSRMFDVLDRNHDGVLDAGEWVGAANRPEMISLSTGGYARAFATKDVMHKIDAKDDGRVSKPEFLAAHDKLFDMMNAKHGEAVDAKQWLTNWPRLRMMARAERAEV